MIRCLKKILRDLLYRTVRLLVHPRAEIREKTLLLVRVDFIGDYVLFRNLIETLRSDPRYEGYSFTFLGNASCKDLFDKLDAHFFDNAIWLDIGRFSREFFYRLRALRRITRQGYEVVINPVYSRSFWEADHIVHLIKAREKIGSAGDLANIGKYRKKISDRYYTRLVPATREVIFEFARNREFFEGLLGRAIALERPEINQTPPETDLSPPNDYALFFIGGSSASKKWAPANYLRVGQHLADHHGLRVVFCGGPGERADLEAIPMTGDQRFIDLVGRTGLWELASLMRGARLMLSNDTMAPHLAAALGMDKVFVVYKGDLYGRCLPYPAALRRGVHAICHPDISRDPQAFQAAANSYGFVNRLDINRITPEMVIEQIDEVLQGRDYAAAEEPRVA